VDVEPVREPDEVDGLDEVRRRRDDLRRSIAEVEHALARPAPGRSVRWGIRVAESLAGLSEEVDAHVAVTEGPHGLYQEILDTAPRLANAVKRLRDEHRVICDDLARAALHLEDELRAGEQEWYAADQWVDEVRVQVTALLGRLGRHRQRGADLVYEAFEVDVGGET
jgi:hypothetical protein